jgi:ribosomal protein S26
VQDLNVSVFSPNAYNIILNAERERKTRSFKTYQSKDIQAKADISKIQLIHWTQLGAIIPFDDAQGRGKVRVYNHQNLIEAMICRELTEASIGVRFIKDWLQWLRSEKFNFTFNFFLKSGRISAEIDEEKKKIMHWLSEMPEKKGHEILSILDSSNSEKDNHINRIINETEEPEKTKLRFWFNEYEASINRRSLIKFDSVNDDPASITRSHTIWEFIKNYPPSLFQFCLVICIEKKKTFRAYICNDDEIHDTHNQRTSIIVFLQKLIREAGNAYEE